MNRPQLWALLKKVGFTESSNPETPDDMTLKFTIQHARVSPKTFVDFICSLESQPKIIQPLQKPLDFP